MGFATPGLKKHIDILPSARLTGKRLMYGNNYFVQVDGFKLPSYQSGNMGLSPLFTYEEKGAPLLLYLLAHIKYTEDHKTGLYRAFTFPPECTHGRYGLPLLWATFRSANYAANRCACYRFRHRRWVVNYRRGLADVPEEYFLKIIQDTSVDKDRTLQP